MADKSHEAIPEDHEAILEEIRRTSGPIEDHLEALATSKELPDLALGVCTIRIDESAPALRAVLARAAAGEALDESEARLLFAGLYVLGGARDSQACAPLLRLLRRPADEVDRLLGDAVTETLAKIVAGVFDGDAEALLATIADASIDGFVRDALLGAAAFLAWEGGIGRERMRAFLERFFEERLAEDQDFAWYGWQKAVALLGLRDLRPLVHQAWAEGRIPEEVLDLEDFEEVLAEAERAPEDIGRFEPEHLGYIEDVVDAVSWCAWGGRADAGDPDDPLPTEGGWIEPAVNPWRHVGRNDPCPCGSGRKFKKCCLGADVSGDDDG